MTSRRQLLGLTGLTTALGVMPSLTPSRWAAAQERTVVSLGTATPGGGFPVYGAAFSETINQTDPTLHVQPRNTKGSLENIPLIESGQVDLALVTGEPLYEARNGIGIGSGKPPANLRLLTAMYSSPGMFAVNGDSPVRRIADLLGKPVAFGAQGSGLVVLARYVLDGLGYDMHKDFQAIFLERAGDGPAMVQDGRAAALWGAGIGWPGFATIAKSPQGARFIVPDAAEVQRILSKHTLLKANLVPANTYPGQPEALHSVGSWSFVIARTNLPDDTAYRLARALHRGTGALGERLAQAKETTAANTVAAAPSSDLIHPGAQRYLREAGFLR